jgi:hypothetical protein
MKTLFVSLVVISLAFFFGCQENSITDPVSNETAMKVQKDSFDSHFHGSLRIERAMRDPYPIMNSFYIINGQVDYDIRIPHTDPMLSSYKQFANIHLVINAELEYVCTVCSPSPQDDLSGFLSEASDDIVVLVANGVSLLEKTYTIQGRNDGMMLKFTFMITNSSVELSAMWLALPTTDIEAIQLNHY